MNIVEINLEDFKKGDDLAWKEVFEKFYRSIVYYASKKLFDDIDKAEDVAQLTFIKLYNSKEKIQSILHMRNFLYNVVANTIYNDCKSEATRKKMEILSYEGKEEFCEIGGNIDFSNEDTKLKLLIEVIENLSEKEKRTLQKYYIATPMRSERRTNAEYIAASRLKSKISNLTGIKRQRTKEILKERKLTSQYLGVSLDSRNNKWKSFVTVENDKTLFLGYFNTEIEAAKRRDEEVKKLGLNKKLNF